MMTSSNPVKSNSLLDLASLTELCSGDLELQNEIIRDIITYIPTYLLKMRNSLDHANAAELRQQAFQLRGTAAVCAITEVPRICRILERYAKKKDFQAAERCYKKIEKHLFLIVDSYSHIA